MEPLQHRFAYVGVVFEFPTAPKDSFLVVNAAYLAARAGTGNETMLVDTGGRDTTGVASRIRTLLGPTAVVIDITNAAPRPGPASPRLTCPA